MSINTKLGGKQDLDRRSYWADRFPDLPSYQAFNHRLNLMESHFQTICLPATYLNQHQQTVRVDHLIDSIRLC